MNASELIYEILSGNVTEVSPVQPLKAPSPTLVKPLGSVIDKSRSQFLNAQDPIVVNVFGRSTEVSSWRAQKAYGPISVKELGSVIEFSPWHPYNSLKATPLVLKVRGSVREAGTLHLYIFVESSKVNDFFLAILDSVNAVEWFPRARVDVTGGGSF